MGRGVGWLLIQMQFDIFNMTNMAEKKIAAFKSSIRNRRFTFPLAGGSSKPRPTLIKYAPEAGRHLAWAICGGAQLGGGFGGENGSQRRGQAVRFQGGITTSEFLETVPRSLWGTRRSPGAGAAAGSPAVSFGWQGSLCL